MRRETQLSRLRLAESYDLRRIKDFVAAAWTLWDGAGSSNEKEQKIIDFGITYQNAPTPEGDNVHSREDFHREAEAFLCDEFITPAYSLCFQ